MSDVKKINKILIIEDDPVQRKNLKKFLETKGYTYLEAVDSEKGLVTFKQHVDDIFMVIMDIHLPGNDGFFFLNQVTKVFHLQDYVLLTADASHETVEKAKSSGASHFMIKPINYSVLDFVIEKSLQTYNIRLQNRNLLEKQPLEKIIEAENLEYGIICEELRKELLIKDNNLNDLSQFINSITNQVDIPSQIQTIVNHVETYQEF